MPRAAAGAGRAAGGARSREKDGEKRARRGKEDHWRGSQGRETRELVILQLGVEV